MTRAARLAALALGAAVVLSGCGAVRGVASAVSQPFAGGGFRGASAEIGGLRFRTRIASEDRRSRGFVTTTAAAGRSVTGALEAGRVRAVDHCIDRFGASDIVWAVGPDRDPSQVSLDDRGALVLSGTCVAR